MGPGAKVGDDFRQRSGKPVCGAGGGRDLEFRCSSEKIECHRVWEFSPACSDCLREIESKIASLEGGWGDMGFEERRGGMK